MEPRFQVWIMCFNHILIRISNLKICSSEIRKLKLEDFKPLSPGDSSAQHRTTPGHYFQCFCVLSLGALSTFILLHRASLLERWLFLACCASKSWKLCSSFRILSLDKEAVRRQCSLVVKRVEFVALVSVCESCLCQFSPRDIRQITYLFVFQ